MATISSEQITDLLVLWSQGDEHARDKLIAMVYKDLQRMAAARLRNERCGHTLAPSDLANEAFLKLLSSAKVRWQNRLHFYAVAARAIRQVLVDHARRHQGEKRGGKLEFVHLDEALVFTPARSAELLALDDALNRLSAQEPRKARVVELRFFGGLSNQEIAEVLEISANTVIRDWDYSKAWLQREIKR